ncbi:MAG: transporter [Sphingomonadales bacterium]|nr:transporter [Sphingomonadales bacterium]
MIDPRIVIAQQPMRAAQIVVVAICIALNALDGFDVLAISFAAPGIAKEWGIGRAMLGVVLSMELIGMAIGSVLIGNVADRVGRRPTIIGCAIVMATGMFAAAGATGLGMLSITRLFTGFGIGGMLATTSAMVAEFSNDRRRPLALSLNIAGYSAGAITGGALASVLLADHGDWRSVFLCGGVATALLIPLVWMFLPESIESLIARRPVDALARVNGTLGRLGIAQVDALPERVATVEKTSFTALFSGGLRPVTILLTIAYFAQIMAFYYIQKWTPKIVVDMGFDPSEAGRVLVCANIGSLTGAIMLGLASQRFHLRSAIVFAMVAAFVAIGMYGVVRPNLLQLSIVAAIAGFFTNSGVVGLYPVLAQTYPAALRAGGTGFVIGMGRGGSAIGPVLAGALFATGASLLTVSLVLASGTLVAALMLVLLPFAQLRAVPS